MCYFKINSGEQRQRRFKGLCIFYTSSNLLRSFVHNFKGGTTMDKEKPNAKSTLYSTGYPRKNAEDLITDSNRNLDRINPE